MPAQFFSNKPSPNYTEANKTAATKVYFEPNVCPATGSDSTAMSLAESAESTMKRMADRGAKYFNFTGGGGGGGSRVRRRVRRKTGRNKRRSKASAKVNQRGGRVTRPSDFFSGIPNPNYTEANKTAATKVYFQPEVCPTTGRDSTGMASTAASTVKHMADQGVKYFNNF